MNGFISIIGLITPNDIVEPNTFMLINIPIYNTAAKTWVARAIPACYIINNGIID